MRLFDDDLYWTQVNDGDQAAFKIFERHYTYRKGLKRDLNKNKKNGKRMAGPGETIVLLGKDGKALFIWNKQLFRKDGQAGINCSVFRNERTMEAGPPLSSELILEAEKIAMNRWPGERMFTFVNVKKVRSKNPGYVYKLAGWQICGTSKARKYLILEKTWKPPTE